MFVRIFTVLVATTDQAVNPEGFGVPAESPKVAAVTAIIAVLIAVAAVVVFFKWLDREKPPRGGAGS